MSAILSLFNHKGGVSKTTTTFNLGWALASKGYKTLMIDGDPQCNLTGTVVGYSGHEDLADYYSKMGQETIHDALFPVFSGVIQDFKIPKIQPTIQENLFLLPGHINFAEYETQISVALTASRSITAIQNLPGSFKHMIDGVAKEYNIDIVLIDMSPSVGAINQCLLMSSNYFLVPTSPDFYCKQAIESLARVLPRWTSDIDPFRDSSRIDFSFGEAPKFIGMISQKYRPRGGGPAKSFQDWIDKIKQAVDDVLIKELVKLNMVVKREDFVAAVKADTPYNLANISDFNSLIAQSQKYNTPVFALSDSQIEQSGYILATMKANRDSFKETFDNLANSVASLTNIAK